MTASTLSIQTSPSSEPLQVRFQALLPRIERHGRVYFRNVKCAVTRAEYIAEMVALCWKWFQRMAARGKDGFRFPMAVARYAAWAVGSGRRVCGKEKATDVLSSTAQQLHGFCVESLPTSTCRALENFYSAIHGQRDMDTFEERLQDNVRTPVPDQVVFRIDFPAWLQTLTARERQLIKAMMLNHRTKDLSKLFEMSPSRISQLRREFMEGWRRFCGETDGRKPKGT